MPDERKGVFTSSSDQSSFHSCLSGNDGIKLLEIIHKSLSCDSDDDFIALFPRLQELFPFDFATAALGYHDDASGIVGVHHVNISFSEAWFREYMSHDYLQKSAVIRENFRNYKLQYWADAWRKLGQPEEIIALCMDFGKREGYTIGARPLLQGKFGGLFCFSSTAMKYDPRTVAILELLTPHLHLALSTIFNNKQAPMESVTLSAREKEVLDWLKQGKSSWEMSVILGISERTANFHVFNIMRKLGATNRAQAVAVAARQGLIDIG